MDLASCALLRDQRMERRAEIGLHRLEGAGFHAQKKNCQQNSYKKNHHKSKILSISFEHDLTNSYPPQLEMLDETFPINCEKPTCKVSVLQGMGSVMVMELDTCFQQAFFLFVTSLFDLVLPFLM